MALILNIETSGTVCSVALAENGNTVALKEINEGYTHAENLTVFIEEIIKEKNTSLKKIDAVAVSGGPGSYTGLRIGVSTAKGICYTLNKPLIAVSTLQSLTLSIKKPKPKTQNPILFCPMIDARRMEVYCALYTIDGKEIMPVCAKVIDENSFKEELKNHQIIFFGDGAEKCKTLLGKNENSVFIDGALPSAANMSSLSEQLYNKEKFEDVAYYEPNYLKSFFTPSTSIQK